MASLIPTALLTLDPSRITAFANCKNSGAWANLPFWSRLIAVSGLTAELINAFAHNTPRIFLLIFVSNPAVSNADRKSTILLDLWLSSSPI
jgi:hypothetical protein